MLVKSLTFMRKFLFLLFFTALVPVSYTHLYQGCPGCQEPDQCSGVESGGGDVGYGTTNTGYQKGILS